jgi:NitT/TauT family transport system ATP-binding protein
MDIRLEHIYKKFDRNNVLTDVSMTLEEGKISCIMGASGSGKTTLMNILMGFLKPDSGDLKGLEGKRIAAMFQEDRLIEHWDAIRNVQLVCGKNITASVVKEHFMEVGLTEYENKPVKTLSGGMRRRVALVRAMLAEGNLLILDEPFKGLDEDLRQQVIQYVIRLSADKTAIIVTHERDEAVWLGAELHYLEKAVSVTDF